jgi:hypothetical protein
LIAHAVPRAFAGAIKRRDFALLALALDLCVPPFSFLTLLFAVSFVLSAMDAAFGGSYAPFIVSLATAALFFAGVGAAWAISGRDLLPLRRIGSLPVYALRKVGIYSRFFSKNRASTWTRSERDNTSRK